MGTPSFDMVLCLACGAVDIMIQRVRRIGFEAGDEITGIHAHGIALDARLDQLCAIPTGSAMLKRFEPANFLAELMLDPCLRAGFQPSDMLAVGAMPRL